MIALIIKSYLTIFASVGLGSLFIFIIGLILIFKIAKASSTLPVRSAVFCEAPSANEEKRAGALIGKDENAMNLTQFSHSSLSVSSEEIEVYTAIAGDNLIATQLDLARAYIETGKSQSAKKILDDVLEQGSFAQKNEAQHLLDFMSQSV